MISKSLAKEKLRRIGEMRFSPRTPEEWAPLLDALTESADDAAHADRIMSDAVALRDRDGNPLVPVAHDIRSIAFRTRNRRIEPDPNCPQCAGTGYERREVERRGLMYDVAVKCSRPGCWAIREKRDDYSTPWEAPKEPIPGLEKVKKL